MPIESLLKQVRSCRLCEAHLPHGVRPVLQIHSDARILIAGQAPGRKVHATGIPFDDPSGERLREWMAVSRQEFYDSKQIAILPMGFCYPGTGKSGDLPPRPECAPAWRRQLLAELPNIALTLVIGSYAIKWHLPESRGSLTEAVRSANLGRDTAVPLPHPSPRNNIWLKKNPWFGQKLLPALQRRVRATLA